MSDKTRSKDMAGKRTRSNRGKSKEGAERDDPKTHTTRIGWNRSHPPRDNIDSTRNSQLSEQPGHSKEATCDKEPQDDDSASHVFGSAVLGQSGKEAAAESVSRSKERVSLVNIEDLDGSDLHASGDLSRLSLTHPPHLQKVKEDHCKDQQDSVLPNTQSNRRESKIHLVAVGSQPVDDSMEDTSVASGLHYDTRTGAGQGAGAGHSNTETNWTAGAGGGAESENTVGARVNKSRWRKTSTRAGAGHDLGALGLEEGNSDPPVLLADIVGKGRPLGKSRDAVNSHHGQVTDSSRTRVEQVVAPCRPVRSESDKARATQAAYSVRGRMEEGGEEAPCPTASGQGRRDAIQGQGAEDVVLNDLEDADESWSGEEGESEGESAVMEAEGEQKQAKGATAMENGECSNHSNGQHGVKTYWGKAAGEVSKANRKISSFLRNIRKRSKRHSRETAVKEIHIVPEQEETQWALRSASSAASRQSASSATSTYSGHSSQDESVPVVNDLEEPVLAALTH